MRIDFVSDVACPWCAVGLNALERALENIGPNMEVEIHFQPFELNPTMAPEGANAADYLKAKYGMSDDQLAHNRSVIRERGAAVGFAFGERAFHFHVFEPQSPADEVGFFEGDAFGECDFLRGAAFAVVNFCFCAVFEKLAVALVAGFGFGQIYALALFFGVGKEVEFGDGVARMAMDANIPIEIIK